MIVADLLTRLGDLALPPRCPGCGATVSAGGRFCTGCWSTLRFIGPPWCEGCHRPFAHDRGEGALCDDCAAMPPRHAGVRAAVAYGPVPRQVALGLKYGGRTGHAATVAALMRRHLPAGATLLVPVPLHRWRLWARGYNQAALIAAALARWSGLPADAGVLERVRGAGSLRGLSRRERRRAVAGAFRIVPGGGVRVAGQHVVLVDDVYTSGATSDGCVHALLDAGAAAVTVLAWARVLDAAEAD